MSEILRSEKKYRSRKNIILAISMGKINYILPIGDDDVLPDGSVKVILNELDGNLEVIILDGWHTDSVLSKHTKHLPAEMLGVTSTNPEEAFGSLWNKMPFGSFVARRDFFDLKYLERYIGTSHAYTGAIWDSLAKKYHRTGSCQVKCMTTPTVLLRGGEKSWRNDAAKIMLYEIPLWFQLVMVDDVYRSIAAPILKNYLKNQTKLLELLRYRASGQLDREMLERLMGIYPDSEIEFMKKIVALPVMPLAGSLATYFALKHLIKRIASR